MTDICVADIICEDERTKAFDRLTACKDDLKKAIVILDDEDPMYLSMQKVKDVQKLVTDAHWSINGAVHPLNEISKGRMV